MRPDFLFFGEGEGGEVVDDIVSPHGDHLADSLPRLRGLAEYAEKQGAHYNRIEAVAKVDGSYRMLDLQNAEVRELVCKAKSAKEANVDPLGAHNG